MVNPKGPKDPTRPALAWQTGLVLANGSPRCGARTRCGGICKQPAMPNRRCRMHGGASTGPRTPEGLERVRAARTTHGQRTAEMETLRKVLQLLRADSKRLLELA